MSAVTKVVEITFTCDDDVDVKREVEWAMKMHWLQKTKHAKRVLTCEVAEIPPGTIEEVARDRLAASMDTLSISLDKLREEGGLT